jgi:hypothetical protein
MREWLDVNPGSWYYNEVMEATNYILEDGDYFIKGIPYNVFEGSSQRIFKEFTAGEGQKEFNLGVTIVVTPSNPLYVYVDGTQVIYEGVKVAGGEIGTTGNVVTLFTGVRAGQIVTFVQGGSPRLSSGVGGLKGRPQVSGNPIYPSKPLDNGDKYYFNTDYMPYKEYCYAYGRQLRRAIIPKEEWFYVSDASKLQALLRKYIGYERDVYTISPNDLSVFPYASFLVNEAMQMGPPYDDGKVRSWVFLPYTLNDVTCRLEYVIRDSATGQFRLVGGNFQAHSPVILYNDRVFPDTYVTNAELWTLINRLRKSFIARFTDTLPGEYRYNLLGDIDAVRVNEYFVAEQGQTHFYLSGRMDEEGLRVYLNGKEMKKADYSMPNSFLVRTKEMMREGSKIVVSGFREDSARFSGLDGWYKWDIIELENELMEEGSYLMEDSLFDPNEAVRRSDAVVILNRFRQWCIQRMKL